MYSNKMEEQISQVFADICKNIRRQRQAMKMPQEKFAEALNVSTQYISQIERGESQPSLKLLLTICYTFDCSIYSLIPQTKAADSDNPDHCFNYHLDNLSARQKKNILSFIDWYTATHTE